MIYVRADFDCGREKGQTADKKLWRETMILAIDIGNTNIVVGCIDQEKTYFIRDFPRSAQKQSWNMQLI